MRPLIILLTTFIFSCASTHNKSHLFDGMTDKESVQIYLSEFNLKAVPTEIGQLRKAKKLHISLKKGWTVYPPLSAFQEMIEMAPFQYLPDEITRLSNLKTLSLEGLDLKTLPVHFDKLKNLDTLYLGMNKLTISNEREKLKNLKNLRYLNVVGNKVVREDIEELKRANPDLIIKSGLE
jgi:hypothetical protein